MDRTSSVPSSVLRLYVDKGHGQPAVVAERSKALFYSVILNCLRDQLTVTTVWKTGDTGDIYYCLAKLISYTGL